MKKTLSILLVFALVFSLGTTALAGSKKCSCGMTPVIYVPGFGEPIYMNPNTEGNYTVFPPEGDAITNAVPAIVKAVLFGLAINNFDAFGTYAMEAANIMLGGAACDKDGNPLEGTGVEYSDPMIDTHKSPAFVSDDKDDNGYFTFIYDWRLDPIHNAKLLRDYIGKVKALTGHSNVVISAHSQGNTVVTSYLHLFGSKGIEKLVFLSPAYQGLSLIGSIFTGNLAVNAKGDALADYLNGIMGYEDATSQLLSAAIKEINEIGSVDAILLHLQKLLDDQFDRIFSESLVDILGTMPGIWSFVPDEYYEAAKEKAFANPDEYSTLIEKIDYYHYKVQNKTEKIIRSAKANGTDIIITAGYNISSIPVTSDETVQSDFLIDTGYMSLGATCAPFGKTLNENHRQKNRFCGHSHISADGIIDASTCAFPEYTWFIKNNGHATFGTDYCAFIEWAIRYDGQPTVHTSKNYPQFIQIKEDNLITVTADDTAEVKSNEEVIITSLITLIKNSFEK